MTESEARQTLAILVNGILVPSQPAINRVIQMAKQIGSGYITESISVSCLYESQNDGYRIVIE